MTKKFEFLPIVIKALSRFFHSNNLLYFWAVKKTQ
jgi:hypothetical protein